jgi:hypothetical protein
VRARVVKCCLPIVCIFLLLLLLLQGNGGKGTALLLRSLGNHICNCESPEIALSIKSIRHSRASSYKKALFFFFFFFFTKQALC